MKKHLQLLCFYIFIYYKVDKNLEWLISSSSLLLYKTSSYAYLLDESQDELTSEYKQHTTLPLHQRVLLNTQVGTGPER